MSDRLSDNRSCCRHGLVIQPFLNPENELIDRAATQDIEDGHIYLEFYSMSAAQRIRVSQRLLPLKNQYRQETALSESIP